MNAKERPTLVIPLPNVPMKVDPIHANVGLGTLELDLTVVIHSEDPVLRSRNISAVSANTIWLTQMAMEDRRHSQCTVTHSRPQSPSFLGHVVRKRGALEAAVTMSENFWHPVGHVQKLQISLLMLITDFSPSPLHWQKHFTSWALSREWLLWDVLKMHHFTQLGFTDNLELKEEDSNRNRLNTLLVCRTETINRQTIVWVMWVFFSIRLANKHWESNIAKIDIMREKVNLKRYLVPCPATAILLQNAFWNETIHVLC